jgi:hypothetical protein
MSPASTREPLAAGRRHIMEDMPRTHTMESQMLDREPSYFDFLMKNRGLRGAHVPFARAAGVLPELARDLRVTRAAARVATNAPGQAAE